MGEGFLRRGASDDKAKISYLVGREAERAPWSRCDDCGSDLQCEGKIFGEE